MAVLEPGEPIWTAVVRAAAGQLCEALSDELGPIRARSVDVTVGAAALEVTVGSGDPDVNTVTWCTCVELSALWPATFLGDQVALDVTVNGQRTLIPHDVMCGVADGWDRGAWRAALSRR